MSSERQLRDALRAQGGRMTLQRQVILESLDAVPEHFTADELYQRVRHRLAELDPSTVYRTLERFEKLGLVYHTHFDDGVVRYHRAEVEAHQHLVCEQCGAEQDIGLDLLKPLGRRLRELHGFEADLTHFVILGRCRACQS